MTYCSGMAWSFVPTLLWCKHCFGANTASMPTLLRCQHCVVPTLFRSNVPTLLCAEWSFVPSSVHVRFGTHCLLEFVAFHVHKTSEPHMFLASSFLAAFSTLRGHGWAHRHVNCRHGHNLVPLLEWCAECANTTVRVISMQHSDQSWLRNRGVHRL